MGIQLGQDPNKEESVKHLWNRIEQPTRQVAGLGGEIATGLALDAKTAWMLNPMFGWVGYAGYGVTNFAGGAVSNIAAQKLRQEENIDWGEVVSSGFLGIIPGTSLRFGRKVTKVLGGAGTYQRAATFGAAQGMTDQVVRQGINEGRLPTAGELATGAVTGGVAGPIFKKSFDEISKIYTKYQGKSAEEINSLLTKRERSSMSYYRKLYLENLDNPKALREIYELKQESDFNYQKDVLGLHKGFKDYRHYKRVTDNIKGQWNSKIDDQGGMDEIKRSIIKSNLESDIVTKFLLGKTTKLPKQHRTLIQNSVLGEVTDADFKGTSGISVPLRPGYIPSTEAYTEYIKPGGRLDQLIEEFPNMKDRFEGLKGSFLWNEHHINHRTAPIDFYVGRTDVAERNKIRDLLVDEFNIFSGNSPLNRIGLPTGLEEADVHTMVHSWLAPRLGERSDVLKAKWAKEVGLKLGPLQTRQGGRQGYLAGQQYLSDADRVTWNNYMSQLPVDGKLMKRFIREYGALIKESEVLIERLMKQFDSFYRVPKSYQIEVTPDDLVDILDNIDPTKEITLPLIERTIREVIKDKKLNMINPVTKEIVGTVQKSEKELDMLFRSDDLLSMLDAANKPGWTGDFKQIRSWATELNEILVKLGLLPKGQLSFDLKKGRISSYLEKMKKARFGDTTLSEIDKPITIDPKIQDLMNE